MIRLRSRFRHVCNVRCTTLLSVTSLVVMLGAAVPAAVHAETAYGLTTTNQLIVFDVADPGVLLGQIDITGFEPGDSIVGIDFRESDAQLFGVGQSGRLYTIHPVTGVAKVVGAGPWTPLAGTQFGVDFNPVTHLLRVTSDADINLSINAATGVVTTQTPLNPGNPAITEIAYAPFGSPRGSTPSTPPAISCSRSRRRRTARSRRSSPSVSTRRMWPGSTSPRPAPGSTPF